MSNSAGAGEMAGNAACKLCQLSLKAMENKSFSAETCPALKRGQSQSNASLRVTAGFANRPRSNWARSAISFLADMKSLT